MATLYARDGTNHLTFTDGAILDKEKFRATLRRLREPPRAVDTMQYEESLAWSTTMVAQHRAAYWGYDPRRAGLQTWILAPSETGALRDWFTDAPLDTDYRLFVHRQHIEQDPELSREDCWYYAHRHLGIKNKRRSLKGLRANADAFLRMLLLRYQEGHEAVEAAITDTGHGYWNSSGFVRP